MVTEEAKRQGIEKSAVRFSRKDVRQFTKWSDSALKKHVSRLEGLEYFLVHGGGSRRRMVYEPVSYTHLDVYKRQRYLVAHASR